MHVVLFCFFRVFLSRALQRLQLFLSVFFCCCLGVFGGFIMLSLSFSFGLFSVLPSAGARRGESW